VTIQVPDDMDDHMIHFMIEDNGCPGTGPVGAEIERLIAEHGVNHTCWACASQGENTILSIKSSVAS